MKSNKKSARRGRPIIERSDTVILKINELIRLAAGRRQVRFRLTSSRGDGSRALDAVLSLELSEDNGMMEIKMRKWRAGGGECSAHTSLLLLDSVPTPGGGRRWFARCPVSGARCLKLFLPDGGDIFKSRDAYGLVSLSERTTVVARARLRLARLRRALGARDDAASGGWPPRPRKMQEAKYRRLIEKIASDEEIVASAFVRDARALLGDTDLFPDSTVPGK